jgi:hypothetical protein
VEESARSGRERLSMGIGHTRELPLKGNKLVLSRIEDGVSGRKGNRARHRCPEGRETTASRSSSKHVSRHGITMANHVTLCPYRMFHAVPSFPYHSI